MNIPLVGALAWNPERVTALSARGHRLFGLWSRTMGWEQGPYPFAEGLITEVDIEGAIDFSPKDYRRLAVDLRCDDMIGGKNERARRCRERFSFESTIDPLIGYFERVRDRYQRHTRQYFQATGGRTARKVHLFSRPWSLRGLFEPHSRVGGLGDQVEMQLCLARSRANWLMGQMTSGYVSRSLKLSHRGQEQLDQTGTNRTIED
jgi:hypothetical protein